MSQGFLPICKKDMEERGWEQLDFVYISGDAYVDHPSFGPPFLASQDLLFLYRQVIWILW